MAKEKVQLSELSLAAMGIFSVALNLTIAALVWRKSLSKKLMWVKNITQTVRIIKFIEIIVK